MRKIHLEKDKDKIKELYWTEELSLREIAKKMGVCMGTIRKNMVLWGIERRPSRKRELVKPSRKKLKKFYWNKKLPTYKIAKDLNTSVGTIFRWLKGYEISPTRRFKYKKHDFSGDPKEKAYILGLVAGDLYVRRNYRHILVELSTTHPAMTDLFYSVFEKYGTPIKYIKYNKTTKRYGWRIYIQLNNSFEFMLSKNLGINNKHFYDFLAGFFDCEGCLYVYNNHGFIGLSALIYNSNKKLLEIIKERLEKDGFHPKLSKYFEVGRKTKEGYYSKVDLWAVRMHTNKEVLSLMNLLPIKHKEKLDKLKIAMSSSNKWEEISDKINNLKMSIKKDVKDYIKPSNAITK